MKRKKGKRNKVCNQDWPSCLDRQKETHRTCVSGTGKCTPVSMLHASNCQATFCFPKISFKLIENCFQWRSIKVWSKRILWFPKGFLRPYFTSWISIWDAALLFNSHSWPCFCLWNVSVKPSDCSNWHQLLFWFHTEPTAFITQAELRALSRATLPIHKVIQCISGAIGDELWTIVSRNIHLYGD